MAVGHDETQRRRLVPEDLPERVPGLAAKILPSLPLYMPNVPGAPLVVIVDPCNVVSDLPNEVMSPRPPPANATLREQN